MPKKKRDAEAIVDEIRENSKLGYSDKISIVDSLLDAGWCQEEDLILAYETLQESDLDLTIALFKLPFVVRLPEKWIKVKSVHGNPFARFRTVGTLINTLDTNKSFHVQKRSRHGATEKFTNAKLPNDIYGLLTQTQVLISFQLWAKRQIQYDQYTKYQALLQDPKAFETTKIYPLKPYYSRRPLTPQTFEIEVADTLYEQIIGILKRFIPIYAVSCRDPFARPPQQLADYFIMTKPGRIVVRGVGESTVAQYAQPYEFLDYSRNLTTVINRIESGRALSIYEEYLLEAERQVELGSSNLAVVQTVMILELFANEIINDRLVREVKKSFAHLPKMPDLIINRMWESQKNRRIRIPLFEKFTKYFPAIGVELPSPIISSLSEAITLRNQIIHHSQAAPLDSQAAKKVVSTGFSVIQHCMSQLIEKNKFRATYT